MHARVGCVEASPSPVYGAALLMRFGAYPPSRVQIPPPPLLFVQAPISRDRGLDAFWDVLGAGRGQPAGLELVGRAWLRGGYWRGGAGPRPDLPYEILGCLAPGCLVGRRGGAGRTTGWPGSAGSGVVRGLAAVACRAAEVLGDQRRGWAAGPHLVWEAIALHTTPEPSDIRPRKWPSSHSRPSPRKPARPSPPPNPRPDFRRRILHAFQADPAHRPPRSPSAIRRPMPRTTAKTTAPARTSSESSRTPPAPNNSRPTATRVFPQVRGAAGNGFRLTPQVM